MNGDSNHCAITMAAEMPTLLKSLAGTPSCYIFRVPNRQVESNANAYKPQIVSVGPYHHGQGRLKLIEQHKPRVFDRLLSRTGGCTDDYFNAVSSRETHIRDSYSEALDWETSDLIKMMILDACFIVEFFRVHSGVIAFDNDPLFSTPWFVSSLMLDLLMIENQIPIFVLREIYELSRSPDDADRSLDEIALGFFNGSLQWPEEDLQRHCGVRNITHLLDLFRLCLVGELEPERPPPIDKVFAQLMPSANQLLLAGIKFKPRKSDNLIAVKFDHGVLQIPPLTLDNFTSYFFLNCVAYEQCYRYCSKHISSYAVLMRCLMSTAVDAAVLSQCGILTNFLGTDEEVARFFNDLFKNVLFDIKSSYLAGTFVEVTQYRQNKWRVWWAGIKRQYFGSPWSIISAAAAFTVLVLTFIQAVFTVYPHYHPKK